MSETPNFLTRAANATGAMPPLVSRILVALAVFVVGGIAGWIGRGVLAGAPDVPTIQMFQDWRLGCPASTVKDASCELSQEVISEQAHARVARLVMIRDKDKGMVLAVTMPLDVLLEPGMGLKFDNEDLRAYQYKTCTEEGCVAVIPVDAQLLASLDKAKDASVVVVAEQNAKTVAIPFSLKGYAEARKAFLGNEAKRSSWFRGLWS
jgi:invasion protein IalB